MKYCAKRRAMLIVDSPQPGREQRYGGKRLLVSTLALTGIESKTQHSISANPSDPKR